MPQRAEPLAVAARAREGEADATCQVGEWQGNGCFRGTFFPDDAPAWFRSEINGLREPHTRAGRTDEAHPFGQTRCSSYRFGDLDDAATVDGVDMAGSGAGGQ